MLLNRSSLIACSSVLILLAGCGEKKRVATRVPPPPPPITSDTAATRSMPNPDVYDNRTPLFVETGMASWYGPPYHNRKAATGEIYDMHQFTAAHKTLPLNS